MVYYKCNNFSIKYFCQKWVRYRKKRTLLFLYHFGGTQIGKLLQTSELELLRFLCVTLFTELRIFYFKVIFMKKLIITLLLSLAFICNITCYNENITVHSASLERHNTIERTVYRTETGRKYHLGYCRYLKYTKIPIKIEDVFQFGLTPCKVCKP